MRALAIDTTRQMLTVVLVDGDKHFKKVINEGSKKHTSLLLLAIETLLTENGLSLSDMDYFGAVIGAGSFTGIRIGVATVNGFAYALKKPLIEVTAFELIAYNKGECVCLIDALHDNYYGAIVKDNEVLSMDFYENGAVPKGNVVCQNLTDDYADELSAVLIKKIKRGETKQKLLPIYLRRSQAEREAEGV
ncbi:MAG: tRNA (adenosine(37)-N6)-threonylcarbamoyltransferase complex dimerization subunit type 1 TsaB [Clostridia bacterium]